MGRDRSAPSRQGQGRSKDVHSAVLVTLCIRVVNRSIGGVGTLPLLHLALRAPGDRYTGHVGGRLGWGCSSRPSDHFLTYPFSRAEII